MTIAIWIIAICEIIRIIQNGIQLFSLIRNREEYDKSGDEALQAFKDSLENEDKLIREWLRGKEHDFREVGDSE